jgi:hypothetical protein
MTTITEATSLLELAVIISEALAAAGITATLSGGAAVSIHSQNRYQSKDLDFVTAASHPDLAAVVVKLGFTPSSAKRLFEHPATQWLVEFPPSPLGFGNLQVDHRDIPVLSTPFGELRVITPQLSVMDRLACYWYHQDPQCWRQAILIARDHALDWDALGAWAMAEGQPQAEILRFKNLVFTG